MESGSHPLRRHEVGGVADERPGGADPTRFGPGTCGVTRPGVVERRLSARLPVNSGSWLWPSKMLAEENIARRASSGEPRPYRASGAGLAVPRMIPSEAA